MPCVRSIGDLVCCDWCNLAAHKTPECSGLPQVPRGTRKRVNGLFACKVCIGIALRGTKLPVHLATRDSRGKYEGRARRPPRSPASPREQVSLPITGNPGDREALLGLNFYEDGLYRADIPTVKSLGKVDLASYELALMKSTRIIEAGNEESLSVGIRLVFLLNMLCLTYVDQEDKKKVRDRILRFNKGEWRALYRESANKVRAFRKEREARRPRKRLQRERRLREQRTLAARELERGHLSKGLSLTLSLGLVDNVSDATIRELYPKSSEKLSREDWDALPIQSVELPAKRWQKILKKLNKATGTGLFNGSNTILKSIADQVEPSRGENEPKATSGLTKGMLALAKFYNSIFKYGVPDDTAYLFADLNTFFSGEEARRPRKVIGNPRPIGARSIHTRVIGRATAQIIKPVVAEHLGTLNAVVDTVGCEKIIKVTTALLEKFPNHVVLLPDIINAFNTMARARMLKTSLRNSR